MSYDILMHISCLDYKSMSMARMMGCTDLTTLAHCSADAAPRSAQIRGRLHG